MLVVDQWEELYTQCEDSESRRRFVDGRGDHVRRHATRTRTDQDQPGSHFAEHGHPGGEEFLVLSGVFSDASGDFPAGHYVHNPQGWVHAPWTDQGCELFVKLCQFQAEDRERVVVDTLAASGWEPIQPAGVSRRMLHAHGEESVALYQMAPGTEGLAMALPLGAELLVLEGRLENGDRRYGPGSWLRFPVGATHRPRSAKGCTLYLKLGGLRYLESAAA